MARPYFLDFALACYANLAIEMYVKLKVITSINFFGVLIPLKILGNNVIMYSRYRVILATFFGAGSPKNLGN